MKQPIIILGGMGPQASLQLHKLILEKSRPFHNGTPDSYPEIMHLSMQIPDFIASTKRYNAALAQIKETCSQISLHSASAIGIACNTAHLMLDELPLNGVAFVSMIESVIAEAKKLNARRVGLLASPQTVRTKLYENAFNAAGIAVVLPNKSELDTLNTIIHKVIEGKNTQEERDKLSAIASHLKAGGADTILLGCTELPLVGVNIEDVTVIDSLSALANSMLEKHYETVV